MHTSRPVNLDLTTIKLPATAIVSILHRAAGIVLFLLMPFMAYLLHKSLKSAESFEALKQCIHQCLITKGLIWVFLSSFLYHTFAGVRHLIMDLGIGVNPVCGRHSAVLVIILSVIGIIGLGVILW